MNSHILLILEQIVAKKSFDEPLDNSNPKRNNKIYTNDKRTNLTSESFISNNCLKKINFNVIKNKYIFISIKTAESVLIY